MLLTILLIVLLRKVASTWLYSLQSLCFCVVYGWCLLAEDCIGQAGIKQHTFTAQVVDPVTTRTARRCRLYLRAGANSGYCNVPVDPHSTAGDCFHHA